MSLNAEAIINHLKLRPHPEGGYYRETYRASGTLSGESLPHGTSGKKAYSTAIYYLVPKGERSRLHRLKFDEVMHFYLGGPFEVIQISAKGNVDRIVVGPDILKGHRLQHVVPANTWFGALPMAGTEFSLYGCTVAPGFDFGDLEIGSRAQLLKEFPQAKSVIEQLTD
jgi:predicted cupin superfamily sugar epimerase